MASFRGVDQKDIVRSLDNFFGFLEDRNIGPLTNRAIAKWRAPGGLLEKIASAPDAATIEEAMRTEGRNVQDNSNFVFWMDCYFDSLLPKIYKNLHSSNAGLELNVLTLVIKDVAAWGGFSMSRGRLHAMFPEDSEIKRYYTDVLNTPDEDIFIRFNHEAFKGPFESYEALFPYYNPEGMRADFNKAANELKDIARQWGMADHVGGINVGNNNSGLYLYVTPELAKAFAEKANGAMKDKNQNMMGMKQGAKFIPCPHYPPA